MTVLSVTEDSFDTIISFPGIVFLDCWAEWCPPCRAFKPVFEAAAKVHTDITFGTIDTAKEVTLAGALEITSIPTIMAFRDGILVFSRAGALRAADLEGLIEAVRALDMDEVRAQARESE